VAGSISHGNFILSMQTPDGAIVDKPDGAIVTVPGKPSYSLTIAMLGMADAALASPEPADSLRWMIAHIYDSQTGGVRHSLDPSDNA
jgi:hypothetical protein